MPFFNKKQDCKYVKEFNWQRKKVMRSKAVKTTKLVASIKVDISSQQAQAKFQNKEKNSFNFSN